MEVLYHVGWNIVGLPLVTESSDYQTVFPNSIQETLFSYNGLYSSEQTLEVGQGYLLRMSQGDLVNFSGGGIDIVNIDVEDGWNLISGLSKVISSDILY